MKKIVTRLMLMLLICMVLTTFSISVYAAETIAYTKTGFSYTHNGGGDHNIIDQALSCSNTLTMNINSGEYTYSGTIGYTGMDLTVTGSGTGLTLSETNTIDELYVRNGANVTMSGGGRIRYVYVDENSTFNATDVQIQAFKQVSGSVSLTNCTVSSEADITAGTLTLSNTAMTMRGSVGTVNVNNNSTFSATNAVIGTLSQTSGSVILTNGSVTTANVSGGTLTANGTAFSKSDGIPVAVSSAGQIRLTGGSITSTGNYSAVSFSGTGVSTITNCNVSSNGTNDIISMNCTTDSTKTNLVISGGTYSGLDEIICQNSGIVIIEGNTVLNSDFNDTSGLNGIGLHIKGGKLTLQGNSILNAYSLVAIETSGTAEFTLGESAKVHAYGKYGIKHIGTGDVNIAGGTIDVDTTDNAYLDYDNLAYGVYIGNSIADVNITGGIINVISNTENSIAYGIYLGIGNLVAQDGDINVSTTANSYNSTVYGIYINTGVATLNDNGTDGLKVVVDAKRGILREVYGVYILDNLNTIGKDFIMEDGLIKVDAGANGQSAVGVIIPIHAQYNTIIDFLGGDIQVNANNGGYGILVQNGLVNIDGGIISTTCPNGYGIQADYGTVKVYSGRVNTNSSNNSHALYVKDEGNVEILADVDNGKIFEVYARGNNSTAMYVESGNFAIRGRGSIFIGTNGLYVANDTIKDVNGINPINGGTFISTSDNSEKLSIKVNNGKISNLLLANYYVRDDGTINLDDPYPGTSVFENSDGTKYVDSDKRVLSNKIYSVIDAEWEIRQALEIGNNGINNYVMPINIQLDENYRTPEVWGVGTDANDGTEVYLGDIDISNDGYSHTLDLNGKQLKYNGSYEFNPYVIDISENGVLTITDTSEAKAGNIFISTNNSEVYNGTDLRPGFTSQTTAVRIVGGRLILNDGKIWTDGNSISNGVLVTDEGYLEVNDGNIMSGYNDSRVNSIHVISGDVNIYGGVIGENENAGYGGNIGIKIESGSLHIYDGEIYGNYNPQGIGIWALGGDILIEGGIIAGDYNTTGSVLDANAIIIGTDGIETVNNPEVTISLGLDTARIGNIIVYDGEFNLEEGTATNGGVIEGNLSVNNNGVANLNGAIIDGNVMIKNTINEENEPRIEINGTTINSNLNIIDGTVEIFDGAILQTTYVSGDGVIRVKDGIFNSFIVNDTAYTNNVELHGGTYQNIESKVVEEGIDFLLEKNHYIKNNSNGVIRVKDVQVLEEVSDDDITYTIGYALDELRNAMDKTKTEHTYVLPCDIFLNQIGPMCENIDGKFNCGDNVLGHIVIEDANYIIDLNGYIIYCDDDTENGHPSANVIQADSGMLTIKDTYGQGAVATRNCDNTILVNGGTLNVEANIISEAEDKNIIKISDGNLNIVSGEVRSVNPDPSAMINAVLVEGGNTSITGGYIFGTNYGIDIADTESYVNIKSGLINSIRNNKTGGKISDLISSYTKVTDENNTVDENDDIDVIWYDLASNNVLDNTTLNTQIIDDDEDTYLGEFKFTTIITPSSGGSSTPHIETFEEKIVKADKNTEIDVGASNGQFNLNIQNIKDMSDKNLDFVVTNNNIKYIIPQDAIDISSIEKDLGAENKLKEISVTIDVNKVTGSEFQDIKYVAKEEGFIVIMDPIEFKMITKYKGKEINVEFFEKYISREIEITKEQASKITTAIVYETDGSIRHVPTKMFSNDGKYFAKINSLTNSKYVLINDEVSFDDINNKWYEDVVNEMASRQIVKGVSDDKFEGDRQITRAEFAAIIVRALGLPENNEAIFTDVKSTDWYYGVIGMAYEKGIITGVGDNKFDPNKNITRQEAMTMIYRASKLTEFNGQTGNNLKSEFKDYGTQASWANEAVDFNLSNKLIVGRDGLISPVDNITRAEVSTVILRLLQKSELIDIRTQI